jgi:hypothetical protein
MVSDDEESDRSFIFASRSFGCDLTGCMCLGGRCQFGSMSSSIHRQPPESKNPTQMLNAPPLTATKIVVERDVEPGPLISQQAQTPPESVPAASAPADEVKQKTARAPRTPRAARTPRRSSDPGGSSTVIGAVATRAVGAMGTVGIENSAAKNVKNVKSVKTTDKNAKTPQNARKRKRPASAVSTVTPRQARRGTRVAPICKKKVIESSSEDEDDARSQRTKPDVFEIRFNHLYKPDSKLPDARFYFGQCEGKSVSQVVVGGPEVLTNGRQNDKFRGIAYCRWMLSDEFKPRPGNAKLIKAVRAHAKAYNRFMNSVEPSTVP